jgi:hypothetical protein
LGDYLLLIRLLKRTPAFVEKPKKLLKYLKENTMLDDDKLQAFFDVLVQWKEEMASPPEE